MSDAPDYGGNYVSSNSMSMDVGGIDFEVDPVEAKGLDQT